MEWLIFFAFAILFFAWLCAWIKGGTFEDVALQLRAENDSLRKKIVDLEKHISDNKPRW